MSNGNQTKDSEPSEFAIWNEYEKVAMHFNDLIMRLRTQALGTLAGVVAISGLAVSFAQKSESTSQLVILLSALVFFTLAWVALYFLDMLYYHKLLEGAVKAILELEKDKQNGQNKKRINLSTKIHEEVPHRMITITAFYGLVLLALLIAVNCAGWQVIGFWASFLPTILFFALITRLAYILVIKNSLQAGVSLWKMIVTLVKETLGARGLKS